MTRTCPACNAEIDAAASACPTCGAELSTAPTSQPSGEESLNPYQSPADALGPSMPAQVSIPLAAGLIVVLAGAWLFSPGLGIGLTLLALPAYARAVGASLQRAARGEVVATHERILSFVGSVVVVVVCSIAGAIAFFVTCLGVLGLARPASTGTESAWIGVVLIALCGLGFLAAAGTVYWLCWPGRRR